MYSTATSNIAVCAIVKAELFYGDRRSQHPTKMLAIQREFLQQFASPPFDDAAAEKYADIRATLESRGLPIGPIDFIIAAIALANNLTLVTHNTGECSRVSGLRLEDWEV